MNGVPTGAGNYPPGVTDADPHFGALDDFTSEHPRAERVTVCDDCGRTCYTGELAKQLAQIERLGERLDPGAEVPAGECMCGALAYLLAEELAPRHFSDEELHYDPAELIDPHTEGDL